MEIHEVVTKDGYKLNMHRIPHGLQKTDKPRIPVFLMHDWIQTASAWIALGPNDSLGKKFKRNSNTFLCLILFYLTAYLLADAGFDVWLGNARGTEYSQKHISLSSKELEYWLFEWHQIGVYDLPACIDYILNVTNRDQLTYVGFSEGTNTFLVMATERPEYNAKITAANLLAPIAFMNGVTNPLFKVIEKYFTVSKEAFINLGIYKILLNYDLVSKIPEVACKLHNNSTKYGCNLILRPLDLANIDCVSFFKTCFLLSNHYQF